MREIFTIADMRAIDADSARFGAPERTLMENAGEAVASAIAARFQVRPVLVLCGPGNNGGDGYVAARRLAERGWPVRVAAIAGDPSTESARDARNAWMGFVEEAKPDLIEGGEQILVDALFGAGLKRPLEGVALGLAQAARARGATAIAVDVPSGLSGDGEHSDGDIFPAALTVTFVRKKPAHVLMPGRALCGEVIIADIGAPKEAVENCALKLWENDPTLWRLPWPHAQAHKHQRGRIYVVSGAHAQTGAARLAARAALRVGAGLVTLLAPPQALYEAAAQLTAIMLAPFVDAQDLRARAANASALVIGPAAGLNAATQENVLALAGLRIPMVLDADGLSVFEAMPHRLFSGLHSDIVLTPHQGEFARLFPDLAHAPSKIEAARAAAARAGAIIVLKGPDSVIAAPDGRAIVNTTGSPFLASAGSGDVLAGLIAGLAGQGMAPFEAAAAAVWLHGKLGEALGPGLIAEDLPEALPALLRTLYTGAH
jgi:hydroxyethylthiazole kinase-like uncharacterized protein yjeF